MDKNGNYNALGVAGQYLMVAPAENLVVMVTNSSSDMGVHFPGKLFYEYIVPAIEANDAIAADPDAQRELAALSGQPELIQEAQAMPEPPSIAQEVSGKTYTLTSVDPILVEVNRGIAFADVVIQLPLFIFATIGLWGLRFFGAVTAWLALGVHIYWPTVAWAKQYLYLQSGVKAEPFALSLHGALAFFFVFSVWASWRRCWRRS